MGDGPQRDSRERRNLLHVCHRCTLSPDDAACVGPRSPVIETRAEIGVQRSFGCTPNSRSRIMDRTDDDFNRIPASASTSALRSMYDHFKMTRNNQQT